MLLTFVSIVNFLVDCEVVKFVGGLSPWLRGYLNRLANSVSRARETSMSSIPLWGWAGSPLNEMGPEGLF